jgi:hypothetical protein
MAGGSGETGNRSYGETEQRTQALKRHNGRREGVACSGESENRGHGGARTRRGGTGGQSGKTQEGSPPRTSGLAKRGLGAKDTPGPKVRALECVLRSPRRKGRL